MLAVNRRAWSRTRGRGLAEKVDGVAVFLTRELRITVNPTSQNLTAKWAGGRLQGIRRAG